MNKTYTESGWEYVSFKCWNGTQWISFDGRFFDGQRFMPTSQPTSFFLLTEDGSSIVTEDGKYLRVLISSENLITVDSDDVLVDENGLALIG